MLRHSIAMSMYKNGISILYFKDFLSHSSVDTTSIYSYADDEVIEKALEAAAHPQNTDGIIEQSEKR